MLHRGPEIEKPPWVSPGAYHRRFHSGALAPQYREAANRVKPKFETSENKSLILEEERKKDSKQIPFLHITTQTKKTHQVFSSLF